MERLEAVVSGKVQGVTYRAFVLAAAKRLALGGLAENLPDGTVRVVAEGERPALDALLAKLRKGPMFAKVSDVESRLLPATGEFRAFDIRYGAG